MLLRRIDIWDWTAIVIFSTDGYDNEEVFRHLVECRAPDSIMQKVSANLEMGRDNEGFTFSNPSLRRSVVYIGPTTSGEEFLSTFVHELAHLVADICIADGVSLKGEAIAYLEGEIALRLSDIVCKMSCDHCRDF